MKYYKIGEEELKNLIENTHRLNALEHGGVDNWITYSDSLFNYISMYINDNKIKDDDDYWFEDIAINELEEYEEISE